ncbi:MAG: helicase HerA-like domain-containing protein [Silanimonas sp.]
MANDALLLGFAEDRPITLPLKFGNRHGLVAGATGTGKTVSILRLVEGFAKAGVPVVIADVKGDVAGLGMAGAMNPKLQARLEALKLAEFGFAALPVAFWDLFGANGHPLRTTVSEIGPTLLSRILELSEAQSGVLDIAFALADAEGLLLLDMDDLRALLGFIGENRDVVSKTYGLVSPQSLAALSRALLKFEQEGARSLLGEPALQLGDLMRTAGDGRGTVNVIAAETLVLKPRLYASFLLWLLSELFETLPEVGDVEKPKLVFVFDEAHLLFADCPPSLQQRIEQVVRLIRSKGVGVYFCTQSPSDIPDVILAQLGHRIQHALRAFTPRDQKAVRVAAETFVANPKLDTARVISELGVGEALVSTLQGGGQPSMGERTVMAPPGCRLGAITPDERAALRAQSGLAGTYDTAVDRDSAAEMLERRAAPTGTGAAAPGSDPSPNAPAPGQAPAEPKSRLNDFLWGSGRRQGAVEAMTKSAARTVGNQLGRSLLRGLLGGLIGGRSR